MRGENQDLMPEFFERTPECLDPLAMERLLDRRMAGEEESATRAHLDACDRCASELLLFEQFRRAEVRPEEMPNIEWIERRLANPREPERISWWNRWLSLPPVPRWAFSLAAVLFVLAASWQLRQSVRPQLDVDGGGAAVYRAEKVDLIEPLGDLAAVPAQLSWNPVAGAVIYHVSVFEVDGSKVWSQETTGTKIEIPSDLASRFLPRKTLLWQVIARNAGGRQVADSARESFRVLP